MKISVSSYSFSQYIYEGKLTQLDCVKKAKEMGFDAIEFIDLDGNTLEEQKEYARKIREEADKLNFPIIAYSIGACLYHDTEEENEKEVERLKGQVEVAAILGVKVMRHDICYELKKEGNGRSFDLMLPTIVKNIRKVTEYAKTFGIRTCSENHGFIAQDSDRMERLYNAVNHENYGLLVDIGNFLCVDENPQFAVSRVAPYAIHVHAKDMLYRTEPTGIVGCMTRGGNYFAGTVVGEGDVPVKKCFTILKRAGYDGYVSIEFEGAGDCIQCIARSKKNLESVLNSL